MSDEPRPYTKAEQTEALLDTFEALVGFWAQAKNERNEPEPRWRLDGLIHSVLCTFDGVNAGLPGFSILPRPHPDDQAFCEAEGENWWPPGRTADDDIADGMLHDEWGRRWRERNPTSPAPKESA